MRQSFNQRHRLLGLITYFFDVLILSYKVRVRVRCNWIKNKRSKIILPAIFLKCTYGTVKSVVATLVGTKRSPRCRLLINNGPDDTYNIVLLFNFRIGESRCIL